MTRRKNKWALPISIICGALAAIGIFSLDGHIIHSLTSGIENHDLRAILAIVLWIFSFGITCAVAILVGYLVGIIVSFLLGGNP